MKIKRDKTSILHGALSLVMLLTFAFTSCAKEPLGLSVHDGDGVEVRVTFPRSLVACATTDETVEGSFDENRLDSVTILVFNEDGSKLETVLSEDVTQKNTILEDKHPNWKLEQTLVVNFLIAPSKPKKVYAIANWGKTDFDRASYTETMLKKELKTITEVAKINGLKAYPMLMSGSISVKNLTTGPVVVKMERQMSKIKMLLHIPIDVQANLPDIEWQTELVTMTVVNVPDKSYIVGQGASPADITFLTSNAISMDDPRPGVQDQTLPAARELMWGKSIYVNENPVVGDTPTNSTCILVQLPYKNRVTNTVVLDNYYKLRVTDISDPLSPHKVLRNTIYNFDISILGMGLPIHNLVADVNIDDKLTVNSWEKGEIIDVGAELNDFNIDHSHLQFQFSGESLKSYITTSIKNWKLVREDGTTIFSFVDGHTSDVKIGDITYLINGTATAATIIASKAESLTAFATQKMFFIVKNMKVPFTVTCDNGFIPNSVLKEAGWPDALLPVEGGLQIAKRGNQILSSGTAQDNDQTKEWKTSETTTPGTTADIGSGRSNTVAMAGAEHPAAQYCRDMGQGWFLPSRSELEFIYNSRTLLGTSYSFLDRHYWSSTEASADQSLAVPFFQNSQPESKSKSENNMIRCVKGAIIPTDSYISRAVLETTAWPKDRLPATGLQVATRGNMRQPGEVPGAEDYRQLWKMRASATPGTDVGGLGMGLSINDVVKTVGAKAHPAVQYCNDMGRGWYLPSEEELMLIYAKQTLLGDAYKFITTSSYWSVTSLTTSGKEGYSKGVNFATGISQEFFKTQVLMIRCVREI